MKQDKTNGKKRIPVWAIVLSVILAVVLVFGGAALIFADSVLSKLSKYDPDETTSVDPSEESFETDEYKDGTDVLDPNDVNWAEDVNAISKDGIVNILLVGQDTRQEGAKGRSDSMMILTIDKNTKAIKVTSLMRDMYVQIPGYSDNRINVAYYFGGYELLKATVEKNFGITIDHFVEIDFFAFQKVVDILGGIYIDLNEEEATALNAWGHRTVPGRNRLDGAAALSYCTMRYVGNSDYERTERQRKALSSIYARLLENATVTTVLSLVEEIFPLITTNMTNGEIMSHAMSLYSMRAAKIEQYRLPADGTFSSAYINGMAVLLPDLEKNREYLREIIYGGAENEG